MPLYVLMNLSEGIVSLNLVNKLNLFIIVNAFYIVELENECKSKQADCFILTNT